MEDMATTGMEAPASVPVTDSAQPAEISTPSTPAHETTREAPVEDVGAELSKVWSKLNPSRDETGKFVSRATPNTAEDAPAEAAPAPEVKPEAKQQEPTTPAVEPPRAWTADAKAKWASLPPDMQSFVAGREQELQDIK